MRAHTVCMAPMLNYTNRHFRWFMRLITRQTFLYTEMVATPALLKGGQQKRFLSFSEVEHPLGIQLAGNKAAELSACAKMAEDAGYDEINLNVGCPSQKIQLARFGACLMAEPERLADCVDAIKKSVTLPVSIKTRLGLSEENQPQTFYHFLETVSKAGCVTFIIHARYAELATLSPKENRKKLPLFYEVVHAAKKAFPHLMMIINGGIEDLSSIQEQLGHVEGVMIGEKAYRDPYFFSAIDRQFYGDSRAILSREQVTEQYLNYIKQNSSVPRSILLKPLQGLYYGTKTAKAWRKKMEV